MRMLAVSAALAAAFTVLPAQAEDMHRAIPASACEIVQSAGHLVNLEQAAPFNALVRQFLGKL